MSPAAAPAAFCTIIAKNYLAYARTLTRALRRHHPAVPVYVLVVDESAGFFDPDREEFTTLSLADLPLPRLRELCFRYDVLELSTAVKPDLLRRLFERGHERLVFLDPDVHVYRPLHALLALLDGWNLVLTPHLTAPLEDARRPSERDVLAAGAYNLGFVALRAGSEIDRLLDWWSDRCREHCVVDPDRGLFVDQRWMDLAPGLIDGAHVLREPGYNVAYWNLAHRHLDGPAEAPLVNGEPLYFFHFSGLDPERPDRISRHQDRFPRVEGEPLRSMVEGYASALMAAGHRAASSWPYTHGAFDDGHTIGREMRELFREQPPGRFPDPFATAGDDTFLRWAITPEPGRGLAPLAARFYRRWRGLDGSRPAGTMGRVRQRGLEWLARRFAFAARASAWLLSSSPLPPVAGRVLDRRPDVRQAFAPLGPDKLGFLRWLSTEGVAHHHLKPSWCAGWLPEGQDPEVMPRLLEIYDSRPDAQRLFPMAFVAEHDAAGYCAWIEEQAAALGLDLRTLLKVRRLFAQDPHARIAEIYASRPDLERAFPGALDDPSQRGFLAWLRYSGWREYGIAEDWVRWFERAREQHACRRLQALYRSRAEWEGVHPLAFSPFGRVAFLAAVREAGNHELVDRLGSPDRLCPLAQSTSLAELRRWHAADASLLARFPRAFKVAADTEALLDWVRGPAAAQYGLDRGWLQRLATEVEGLGLGGEGINVLGYLRTESGMGELARATVRSLAAVGYPFATHNLSNAPQRQWDSSVGHRDAEGPHPFTLVHVNAPEVWRLRTREGPRWTGYAIGYWAWELGELPREWGDSFQFFDEVWTCSRYAATAIAAASPVPVQTIWPSLPETRPLPLGRADFGLEPDTFTFLFAYDLMSETERKNPVGLVEAFRRAFRRDDRARLVLKTTGGDSRKADLARVADAAAGLPITLMDRYLSRPELGALIAACDAYVSLHRAEGFGFTLAEAMAAGKPVAATYHSGNVDYMTPWNSFPIPFRMVDIPETCGPYRRGGSWAEPDLDAAAEVLRTLYRERERAREVALRGQSEVCAQLSAEACGRRITSRLGVVSPRAVKARARSSPAAW